MRCLPTRIPRTRHYALNIASPTEGRHRTCIDKNRPIHPIDNPVIQ
jgi:hypothetical protein